MYILNIGVSITLKSDFLNKYLVYEKQFQTLFCCKIIKRLLFIFYKRPLEKAFAINCATFDAPSLCSSFLRCDLTVSVLRFS